ncbi:MAG: RecQ family ATP-dependent DNA helicase [Bacteroidales bacterium]|nr:RecQ family ATP-dependent DNA helicase [Bacteroidales bacterium]
MDKYLSILKNYWGYDSFRPVQAEIIDSIASGKDTLGLMPTGGGKSITFQVPALDKEGICIVISPLIALMNDQVEKLKSINIKAFAIHSGLTYHEIQVALDNAVFGAYKILYVSPERLSTDIFIAKLKAMNVSFITVDEAHCISQWGYDFRPSYLEIARIRKYLPEIPILALTATATPEVIEDIQKKLEFRSENVFIDDFTRENLVYFVRQSDSKTADLIKLVDWIKGTGIIYVRNRKNTREIAKHLQRNNIIADFYHAGLTFEKRQYKQQLWTSEKIRIMVATNAFGMGIDKSNVRFVIHMDLPDSPEAYFQEAGRAGRDSKKAYAVLLVNNHDKTVARQRISNLFPEISDMKRIYNAAANFLQVPVGGGKGMAYEFDLYEFATAYRLSAIVAYNALKFIEKLGYIELTDELNNPSRVYFLLGRDDLYKFQIGNRKFDGFIKLLLRSYTGLFSNYVAIDEQMLAKRANISYDLVYQYLVKLSQLKVINYIPRRKSPLYIFSEERLDEKSLHIPNEFYKERRQRFEQRMEAMLDYAFSNNECRSIKLLKYFGQTSGKPCEQCDVCKSRLYDDESNERIEYFAGEILNALKKDAQYLGELALMLEIKESVLEKAVRILLEREQIHYIEDGRIAIGE